MLRRFSVLTLALFAASALLACGDSGQASFATDGTNNRPANQNENQNQTPSQSAYELRIVGDAHRTVHVGEHADLGVRLISTVGQPAQNQAINFEIMNTTGDGGVRLDAGSIFVNSAGQSTNRLHVGQTTGQIVVHATHAWVNEPAVFTIDIDLLPVGDINVAFEHDQQHLLELSDIEVRVWYNNLVQCPTPAFSLPVDPFLQEDMVATIQNTTTFSDLSTDANYTIGVVAHGPDGQISGRGCLDNISVVAAGQTDVTIPLILIPLIPAGTYDVTSFWDFGDALASTGNVGATIVTALDWIADPAQMLTDYVLGLADSFVCDYLGVSGSGYDAEDCVCIHYGLLSWQCLGGIWAGDGIRGEIEDLITGAVNSIGFVQDVSEIGTDLRDTVRNMKIDSVLTIENKAVGEGEVGGTDRWLGMYFYWTRNCDANSPPDCGEIYIGLDGGSEFGVMEAQWDGRVYDYNQLEIDPHEMVMPYGQVILYILNNVLLPALSGGNANDIGEFLNYMICSNVGSVSVVGINVPIGTLCSAAVSFASFWLDGFLGDLTFDIDLFVSGVGTMADLQSNSLVDIIYDGEFLGQLYNEDGDATDIDATFEAHRRP